MAVSKELDDAAAELYRQWPDADIDTRLKIFDRLLARDKLKAKIEEDDEGSAFRRPPAVTTKGATTQ